MDEEDGRPGAMAAQTGHRDAPSDVPTLSLQNSTVILSVARSRLARAAQSKDLRLYLAPSATALRAPILTISLCREGEEATSPKAFAAHHIPHQTWEGRRPLAPPQVEEKP